MHARSITRSLALVVAVLGGSMAVTAQSEAAIVNITSGFGIGAVNGGVAAGSSQTFSGLFGTTHGLEINNGVGGGMLWSLRRSGFEFTEFLVNQADSNLGLTVSANTMLDSSLNWSGFSPLAKCDLRNDYIPTNMASFGPGNYVAIRTFDSVNLGWLYGYLEVTWDSTTNEFNILSGAYESVVGQGIMTPSAVPGGAGLAACALLGAAGRRRRR